MTVHYLPPPRSLPSARLSAMRAELELFVSTEQPPRKRGWRGRKSLTGLGVGVILVAGGGTAYALTHLHPRAVTDKTQARCYSDDLYTPGRSFHGTTVAVPDSPTAAGRVHDAVDACSSLWQIGVLQPGAVRAIGHPTPSSYPVPGLVGCTLPNGVAVVFPGSADTCDRLGLAPQLPPALQSPRPAAASPRPSAPASTSPP